MLCNKFFAKQECYISKKIQLETERGRLRAVFIEDEERTLRWITFNRTVLLLLYCSSKA